jgi:hypothetical protein
MMIIGNVVIGNTRQDVIKLRHSFRPYVVCTPFRPEKAGDTCCGGIGSAVTGRNQGFALSETVIAPSLREGSRMLLQTAGVGILKPNILMLGFMESWKDKATGATDEKFKQTAEQYVKMIQDAFKMRMGVMICRHIGRAMKVARQTGTVDVWWICDDGGLTTLMPHIMMKAKFWNKANTRRRVGNLRSDKQIRLFRVVDTAVSSAQREVQKMRRLMARFGTDWDLNPVSLGHETEGRPEDKMPSTDTLDEHDALPVQPCKEQERSEWVLRWLRVAELITKESCNAKLVYVTLPFPRSWVNHFNWLGWIEMLSKNLTCSVVFIRGNGRDCTKHVF